MQGGVGETFRELVRVPMDAERLDRYLTRVFPAPIEIKHDLTERQASALGRDRAWSEYFFDQGAGNRLAGVKGTLWAAYNGATEWLDHRQTCQSATRRLSSIWFGEANRVKARALTVAVEMLPHWRN